MTRTIRHGKVHDAFTDTSQNKIMSYSKGWKENQQNGAVWPAVVVLILGILWSALAPMY